MAERPLTLHARVAADVGTLRLDVDLHVAHGEVVAVVGPNGAGKTTLLRVLAGLLPPASGRVVLGDTVLDDTDAGVHVRPEHRSVAVVFQDLLLFPHLTASDNVAFGLRARGVGRAAARHRAEEILGRVGLAERVASRPSELSGGQAQRVALARALAPQPELLLLDEPLASLDPSTRAEVRRELRRQLRTFPGLRLLVTHDPVEAVTLADRLVVLEAGRIVQDGTPGEVRARPRSRYVADLVGTNLYAGRAVGGVVGLADGRSLVAAGAPDGDVLVTVAPRHVTLYRHRPDGSARNVWAGRVDALDPLGDRVRVRVRVGGELAVVAEVTPAAVSELGLVDDADVWVGVKATEVDAYPA